MQQKVLLQISASFCINKDLYSSYICSFVQVEGQLLQSFMKLQFLSYSQKHNSTQLNHIRVYNMRKAKDYKNQKNISTSCVLSESRCPNIAVFVALVIVAKQYMALTTQIFKIRGQQARDRSKRSNFLGQNVCRRKKLCKGFLKASGREAVWIEIKSNFRQPLGVQRSTKKKPG